LLSPLARRTSSSASVSLSLILRIASETNSPSLGAHPRRRGLRAHQCHRNLVSHAHLHDPSSIDKLQFRWITDCQRHRPFFLTHCLIRRYVCGGRLFTLIHKSSCPEPTTAPPSGPDAGVLPVPVASHGFSTTRTFSLLDVGVVFL
jgi:hypothetical protein